MNWPPNYTLKPHSRARYVKLKASLHRGLEIIVPLRFNPKQVPAILEDNKSWIQKKLQELNRADITLLPEKISLLACEREWSICYINTTNKKMILMQRPQQELVLLGNITHKITCKKLLTQWLKEKAEDFLISQLNILSKQYNLCYKKAIIRGQNTRWGSCSSEKTISLNYKLLFLPPHLMKHIVIHELCHTLHLNHSIRFWRLMAKLDPEWKEHNRQVRYAEQYVPAWLMEK